jgi:hypothetical protein
MPKSILMSLIVIAMMIALDVHYRVKAAFPPR